MRTLAALMVAVAALPAQPPAIRTGGVCNAAHRTPSMLPGGAIARGALFEIAGVRLGTGTRTTSVTVSAHGVTLPVPLLAVSAQLVRGRMPLDAPLGDVSLRVTVNGVAGAPYALKVVPAGFGIFSRNARGWGPGRVDQQSADGARSANSLGHAAAPGQVLVLAGTGLGISGAEVWAGGRRAAVVAARRGTAGEADEIVFRLPSDAPTGCFVPLQVHQPAAVPSNTVTVSIHAGGGACEPPAALPVAAWSGRTAGLVVISRTLRSPDAIADGAMADFVSFDDADAALTPILLIPPPGACAAYTGEMASESQPSASFGDALMSSAHTTGLDAGRRLHVAHDNLRQPISPVPQVPGLYRRLLGEQREGLAGRGGGLFLGPGNLVIEGEGGRDVGPFTVSLPAPESLVWENREALGTVDRRRGVSLRWRAPAKTGGVMLIGLTSVHPSGAAWGACYCAAPAASGSFTIPPEMLANLPASQAAPTLPGPALWVSFLAAGGRQEWHATGLDHAVAISLFLQILEVEVR